jgi:cytochrome c553
MKRLVLVALLSAGGLAHAQGAPSVDPFTGGNAEAGAAKAATCGACHGPAGNSSNPEWPKLAGQNAAYLYRSLQALKSGARLAPVMNAQAKPLSDQDMKDLAAYYASQRPTPGVASPDAVKLADRIYRVGDPARGLPACSACHGPEGKGNAGAGYPRLGGQHARYSANVLRAYYRAKPAVDDAGSMRAIMAAVAEKLTEAEIDALASYVNGLH